MAKLTKADVEHIAKLSKLELTEKEKDKFAGQLSSILEYVNQLNEVKTVGVEETSQVTGLKNVFTEDQVIEDLLLPEQLSRNAPDFRNDSFVVPAVFGDERS